MSFGVCIPWQRYWTEPSLPPLCRPLQVEAALHLVGDHLPDGEGGGGGGGGRVAHVQHAAGHVAHAAVEHEVVHQVPVAVQSLGPHPRWAPGDPHQKLPYIYTFDEIFVWRIMVIWLQINYVI